MKKYSKILKQNISVDNKNKTLSTDDGCFYNSSELKLLKDSNDNQKLKVHLTKKIFNGIVVN